MRHMPSGRGWSRGRGRCLADWPEDVGGEATLLDEPLAVGTEDICYSTCRYWAIGALLLFQHAEELVVGGEG